MRVTWAALAASLLIASSAGVAHAYQLVSSPLPTNTNTSGACYIRNTGTVAVSVLVSLFSNNGLIVSFDNCNGDGPTIPGSLGPGKTCVILVDDLPDDSYAACSVTSSQSLGKVRGSLEVRELPNATLGTVFRTLVAEELR